MGLLDRFKGRLDERRQLVADRKRAKESFRKEELAAKRIIRKKERAEYFRALEKEKLSRARGRAKTAATPFGERLGKQLRTTGKELRKYQKKVQARNKVKSNQEGGFSFAGPNVGTPKDNDLLEVKDFRK